MTREEQIQTLLNDPERLLHKKPFFRGGSLSVSDRTQGMEADALAKTRANLPNLRRNIISQEQYLKELDPQAHLVMFDDNIPSICVKATDGSYIDVRFERCALNLQERIREKQTLVMCGNPTQFNLVGAEHTEQDNRNFATIKEAWVERNMDGMRTKAVFTQKGTGDCGLLFYYDYKGRIKARLLSYEDGYVLIRHNDDNGDSLLDCVYYADENGVEHIDCYDDKYMYRMKNAGDSDDNGDKGWICDAPALHQFPESPLIIKRGDVAWDKVQSLIDIYEIIYNIFMVIQKRHGWGILYIRGRINDTMKKIAGSVVLQDTSIDGNGQVDFKAPPSPAGMLETLKSLLEQIQIGASTTFLLPEYVRSSGDISALAVMLTQSLDIEGGAQAIIDWQNFIDKMKRLFIAGIAKEHVAAGINTKAVTEYAQLRITANMKLWRPFNEFEYNQMLATMKGAGIISTKTAVEKNTVSTPDELMRIGQEAKELQEANILEASNNRNIE